MSVVQDIQSVMFCYGSPNKQVQEEKSVKASVTHDISCIRLILMFCPALKIFFPCFFFFSFIMSLSLLSEDQIPPHPICTPHHPQQRHILAAAFCFFACSPQFSSRVLFLTVFQIVVFSFSLYVVTDGFQFIRIQEKDK